MATLHVRLDFTVSKSPLVPFNSTICSRNDPKRHQRAHLPFHPLLYMCVYCKENSLPA